MNYHIAPILHPVRPLARIPPTISCQFYSCVGTIGSIFVCEAWGLRATDLMISVVARPDETSGIAITPGLAASAASGQAGLRARPSNASLQSEAGSPYNVSTYSDVTSYASSPTGSPMLSYSPYTPASAPPPLSGRRTPSGGTGGFRYTGRTGFSPGWNAPGSAPAAGGM